MRTIRPEKVLLDEIKSISIELQKFMKNNRLSSIYEIPDVVIKTLENQHKMFNLYNHRDIFESIDFLHDDISAYSTQQVRNILNKWFAIKNKYAKFTYLNEINNNDNIQQQPTNVEQPTTIDNNVEEPITTDKDSNTYEDIHKLVDELQNLSTSLDAIKLKDSISIKDIDIKIESSLIIKPIKDRMITIIDSIKYLLNTLNI